MNERTGEEIREVVRNARVARIYGGISEEQRDWLLTFLTLPPSAESLRETAA
jgi:hypothetical protein